jgi:Ca2+:H+ antiporter
MSNEFDQSKEKANSGLIVQHREEQHDASSVNSSNIYPNNNNLSAGNKNNNVAEGSNPVVEPGTKKYKEPTAIQGLMSIVRSSWLNVLLIFVPLGWASNFVWPPTVTFILNFVAIVPLAKLLGNITEDISLRTGEIIGGLLNATFGNSVELIISIISLTKGLITVVKSSMLGSILSNLLLVLGMSFFCGGCKYKEQQFNITAAQTSASLLFISVVSLLLPAAFYGSTVNAESAAKERSDILNISRATSIILLIIYFAYLVFQVLSIKFLVTVSQHKLTLYFSISS